MKGHSIRMLLTAAVLATIVLAACGSGTATPQELTVEASDFKFDPVTLKEFTATYMPEEASNL